MSDESSELTRTRPGFLPRRAQTPDPASPVSQLRPPAPATVNDDDRSSEDPAGAPSGTATAGTTSSSSSRRPRPSTEAQKEIARGMGTAIAGLLAVGLLAAGLVLRRGGRETWAMSEVERDEIANPLGRIAARHVPMDLAPDVVLTLKDLGEFAGAAARWVQSAPRATAAARARRAAQATAAADQAAADAAAAAAVAVSAR